MIIPLLARPCSSGLAKTSVGFVNSNRLEPEPAVDENYNAH
jgi:hypothetical protein